MDKSMSEGPIDIMTGSTDKVSSVAEEIHFEYSRHVNVSRRVLIASCLAIFFILLTGTKDFQLFGVKLFENSATERMSYYFIFFILCYQISAFYLATSRELKRVTFNFAALKDSSVEKGALENLDSTIRSTIMILQKVNREGNLENVTKKVRVSIEKANKVLDNIHKPIGEPQREDIDCEKDCDEGHCEIRHNFSRIRMHLEEPLDLFALNQLKRLELALNNYEKGLRRFDRHKRIEFLWLGYRLPLLLAVGVWLFVLCKIFSLEGLINLFSKMIGFIIVY